MDYKFVSKDFEQKEPPKCRCPFCYSTPELVDNVRKELGDSIDQQIFARVALEYGISLGEDDETTPVD